ncbi:MAG: Mu-like prophage major head subunit gpT family protein [Thiobacillus sp.]|jgi:phage major head subunit gpT-like protein|uniref:Mu-like prophage major head subunit gpT family protein n=1 Tax=Thiobacillus sp. TaxID=924 RepID=UPI0028947FA9|nr:Mu-like prophage major head subunit gpT family protein [Thiobacillus sp.]MDT3707474.1 Mu-like prophage major head subunit gpT family protein [Thiobacillus sp.]
MKRFPKFALLVGMAVMALAAAPAVAGLPQIDHGLAVIGIGGMLVNKSALDSIFTGLKTIFNNTLKAQPGAWQATAMEVPSTGAGEDYAWLSRFPKMRKWVGEKFIKVLEAGKFYKKNEDWETTIAVDRNDIEDDRLGIYNTQAMGAGESAGELRDIIVDDLKNGAFANLCMDGQFFYDTDHPLKNSDGVTTSVSNKLTAALSAATLAAASASYGAARQAIMGFTDSEGMALRLIPDTLEVPPALEAVARILCEADKLQDNSPNPYKGTAKVLVNPALTSATAWMLHVTSKQSIKPFIIQMRKAPTFVSQTDMASEDVFNKREYKFGAEARATGVYGFWQLSCGSTGV